MKTYNSKTTRSYTLKPSNWLWGWLGKGKCVKAVVQLGGQLHWCSMPVEEYNKISEKKQLTGIIFLKKPYGWEVDADDIWETLEG